MKTALVLAATACTALALPAPAVAGMTTTTTYSTVVADASWTTAPRSGDFVPGKVYRDTSLAGMRFVKTDAGGTTTKRYAYYDQFRYTIGKNGREHGIKFVSGQARNDAVSITDSRLRSFALTARFRTRTCILPEKTCTRGHLRAGGTWTGSGTHWVSHSFFVTHVPGFPAARMQDLETGRGATVAMTPDPPGHLEFADIVSGRTRITDSLG